MSSLPTGEVTFLFTDIEGSTRLLHTLGDSTYATLLQVHRDAVLGAVAAHDGVSFGSAGDSLFVAFADAASAISAAISAQRALDSHPWENGIEVRVRMGIHTGAPMIAAETYVGVVVHQAARLCDLGHGGQVLISEAARISSGDREDVHFIDLGEHRIRDLANTHRLYQVAAAGLRRDFQPLRSLSVLPNNLPVQISSFVGRAYEQRKVRTLLDRSRLLTLTGVGGAGKTRLALQVGGECVPAFLHGVWFVDLAPIADPMLVAEVAARAVGAPEDPSRSGSERVADHLREKAALVILDNCEHVIDEVARLADEVLRACPAVRILATSRQPLEINGEVTWRVPSMAAPDRGEQSSVHALTQYESVRLFIERAVAVRSDFAVTDQNAPAVAEICHRLGGIPLALELAAARIRHMTPEEIRAGLDDRFKILASSARNVLPRQATLRAAVDWSYEVLTEEERTVFCSASVFAGTFGEDAVMAVCGEGGRDVIRRLVERSLIQDEHIGEGTRYRMLESLREYARDRLLEKTDEDPIRRLHLQWCLDLVSGPQSPEWVAIVRREEDNIRAALAFAAQSDAVDALLSLTVAMGSFWFTDVRVREGLMWCERAIELSEGVPPTRERGLVAVRMASLGSPDSERYCHLALAEFRAIGDQDGIAAALKDLAVLAYVRRDLPRARALLEESLVIARVYGEPSTLGRGLGMLGTLCRDAGDVDGARAAFDEALVVARSGGPGASYEIVTALQDVSSLHAREAQRDEADRLLGEAEDVARSADMPAMLANVLDARSRLALAHGDLAAARASVVEALEIVRTEDGVGDEYVLLDGLARVCTAEGKRAEAHELFARAIEGAAAIGHEFYRGIAAIGISEAWGADGMRVEARRALDSALGDILGLGDAGTTVEAAERLAWVTEDGREAAQLLGAAEARRRELGIVLTPMERSRHDDAVSRSRAAAGETVFQEALAEGAALQLEELLQRVMTDQAAPLAEEPMV